MCHEMEEEEHLRLYLAAAGSAGKTCVQCHMPTSGERLTQGHVLSYIHHPKRIVHDHAFPSWSPSLTAGAVEIGQPTAARASGEVIEVSFTLWNRGAGHELPQRVRVLVQRLNKDRSFQYTLAEGEWPILQPAGR